MASTTADIAAPGEWRGLVRLAASELSSAGLRRLKGLVPSLPVFKADGLGMPIPSLKRGNPDRAAEIYRGRYAFGSIVVEAGGRSVFDCAGAPDRWLEALHGFDWFAHLQASGRELSRVQARSLIREWALRSRRHPRPAFGTAVRARRLISWVRHARFILSGASSEFYAAFIGIATAEARRLARQLIGETDDAARLTGAIALAHASLGLAGLRSTWGAAAERLVHELGGLIVADGGHRSRSPAALLDVLLNLLPLRMALEEAKVEIPLGLNAALERMVPMLRFFLHGDGGLAVFHGIDETATGKARAVLEVDRVEGRSLVHAIHSGYARLVQGPCVVIADVGRPAPPGTNPRTASSPLAFEFSDGPSRIIVNCGSPRSSSAEWNKAARLTGAHSTICLGRANASTILENAVVEKIFGTPVLLGPRTVNADLSQTREGSVLQARHDGYISRFGILVERRLYLASSGRDLRGEDRFFADLDRAGDIEAVDFAIRFHLHPSVKATLAKDGASIILLLPDRGGWRFSAKGGQTRLQDSIYLLGRSGPRRTQQIVVTGIVGRPDRVNWAFKRIEKRTGQAVEQDHLGALPLQDP